MESTMQADKEKINNKNSKISKQTHIIEEIGENGEIQYNCMACQRSFRSRSQRYYHIKCNELQNLVFKCEYCDKSFGRQTQWKYHTESHISPVNECQNCQKTFSNPLALKKHLALHTVEPKLCPHCDKVFKKKISLDQHIAAQHLNQFQYGCAHCSKKYASKSSLQLHLQTHEQKRFECTFCGKLFQRNSILNLHLKRHYNMNSYVCTVCQKVFSESGALARHRKIHEESVLQYYCKLCDKSILRKDNMTRHLITIHPEEKFDEIVKTIRFPIPTEKNTVEVEICDIYKSKQGNKMKSDKSFLIIENKLLRESFEAKEPIEGVPESFTNKDNIAEYPLINHIKVITAAPTRIKEVCTHNSENISEDYTKQHKTANHHQSQPENSALENPINSYENSIRVTANCDFINVENKVLKFKENISFVDHVQADLRKTPFSQVDEQTVKQACGNIEEYFSTYKNELEIFDTTLVNQQQSIVNEPTRTQTFSNEPIITQTFSSVIRSVGNVEKNLTSNVVIPSQPINQVTLDYKHKKYCRNNYNIDLYRKILGCDENADENVEKEEKCDHMLKSSTPVHWRKCFKHNYETTGS